jgi:alkaline phosphatase D
MLHHLRERAMGQPLDAWLRHELTRRAMLGSGLTLLGLSHGRLSGQTLQSRPRFTRTPFALGVASGDPSADGMVIWTRLAPSPLEPGGGMTPGPIEVQWEIARDERFANVVQRGRTTARDAWAHAVHVEIDGLDADRPYWYRFRAGDALSPAGRTRTLPRAGTDVDRLRFAFCSCQHYEQGLYTAHRHLAGEDLDVVFFLGDYIYEGPGTPGRVREHLGPEIVTLEDYRRRYAQYKSDPDLQAAHAACPWIVTPDDHEVENNYAAEVSETNEPVDVFLARRAAAYRAYYEHMPLRRTSMPQGPWLPVYRRFSYGALASFFVLDERQYRSDQVCGDGAGPPCAAALDPARTMLGADQVQWLAEGLDRSRARWNVLPQQVMMADVDLTPGPNVRLSMDQWPGYEHERRWLLDFLHTRRPANPVVLTGDIHSSWVNDLVHRDASDRAAVVATELVGTSMSSGGDGGPLSARAQSMVAENPFVKFHHTRRGYVSCELTSKALRAAYRVVDVVTKPGAPLRTEATFVVENGRPGAQRA